MYSEFVKEFQIAEMTECEKDKELLNNIQIVKNTLGNMYNNIQFADSDYQIKAEESKYNYLIKQAKKKNLNIIKAI